MASTDPGVPSKRTIKHVSPPDGEPESVLACQRRYRKATPTSLFVEPHGTISKLRATSNCERAPPIQRAHGQSSVSVSCQLFNQACRAVDTPSSTTALHLRNIATNTRPSDIAIGSSDTGARRCHIGRFKAVHTTQTNRQPPQGCSPAFGRALATLTTSQNRPAPSGCPVGSHADRPTQDRRSEMGQYRRLEYIKRTSPSLVIGKLAPFFIVNPHEQHKRSQMLCAPNAKSQDQCKSF